MEFIKGMDISMLPELEDAGVTYYDNGNPEELLSVLQKKWGKCHSASNLERPI